MERLLTTRIPNISHLAWHGLSTQSRLSLVRWLRQNGVLSCSNGSVFQRRNLTCSQLGSILRKSDRVSKYQCMQTLRSFHREARALCSLLQRSGLTDTAWNVSMRSSQRHHFGTSSKQHNQEKPSQEEKKEEEPPKPLGNLLLVLLLVGLFFLMELYGEYGSSSPNFISWNDFYYELLSKGEVERVIIRLDEDLVTILVYPGAIIKGRKVEQLYFNLKTPDIYQFEKKVRKAEEELGVKDGITITYHRISSISRIIALSAMVLVAYLFIRRLPKIQMPSANDLFGNITKAKFVRVDVTSQHGRGITFKEVAGLKEAKIEIMEFVDYLKTPQRFKDLGAKIPKGALLLGPPGCGKTLLAKAVATEAKVPFLAMAGSDFVEMIGGLGASRVRDLFKEAKKKAPCIIYIDEIDAIGRKRGGGGDFTNTEEEQTLNQLLVEMDGMGTQEGVIMLAATNRADVLDKALLRPGRFDRHITIDFPTLAERQEMFEMYLKKLKLAQPINTYAPKLAQLTPGMSGADIANVCNEAALYAARESKKEVDALDFEYAIERAIAGVAKKSRLLSPNEKKVVAYHESGHALIGWMLKHTDALLRISIVPRTSSILGFAQYVPSDKKLYSTEELFERMCMALGGRAAEAVFFNHVTTGAEDDLKRVTKLAFDQIKKYGMSQRIGHLSFPDADEGFGTKPYSKRLAAMIDEEASSLVARAYKHTEKVILDNKDKLQKIAEVLLEKEVLTYEDVEALIGPPPYGKKKLLESDGWKGMI
ncbi:hypothetical protein ACJMK2_010086 [Sinanodonta woodiana]|uniref:AAA+ ATPase domain-containing protein n=1 Tax=Sinanodonta woodiana TaxID=1069815 RepID=A0ABD3VEB5_SINWO